VPTGGDRVDALVDTSVAVAILVADHEHHRATLDAVAGRRLALAGHAVFETFSVLSRLPPPSRRRPHEVVRLLEENFAGAAHLTPGAATRLVGRLAPLGIAGGAVYDALVGASAAESGLPLLTRDRRATAVYRALDLRVEIVG
jgi:predicted nucleic acid-binding protein